MTGLYITIVAMAVIWVAFKWYESQKGEGSTDDSNDSPSLNLKYYYLKKQFFNQSEKMFFSILHSGVAGKYIVLSKVRLEDVVGVQKKSSGDDKDVSSEKYGARKRVSSRHLDFVLLDETSMTPVAAIELDGKSHGSAKAKKSDEFKNQLCSHVGIHLFRVRVGEDFEPKVQEMLTSLETK